MWPALVDPDAPGRPGPEGRPPGRGRARGGRRLGQGTFDAGGPCRLGVPTVMYGATGGVWPTGADFVPISAVEAEARVLARLILSELGPED